MEKETNTLPEFRTELDRMREITMRQLGSFRAELTSMRRDMDVQRHNAMHNNGATLILGMVLGGLLIVALNDA